MPYTIFIDDSGTGGALVDWDGNLTSIEQPVTTTGGLVVDDKYISEFSADVFFAKR
ncbi:MAG: DUF3800 domain-containing protein [Pleurocapsa sp. SU_196_0]|nr:DUF3800 domain-containing protein [Pleurocapsa sp. SU_196_0]